MLGCILREVSFNRRRVHNIARNLLSIAVLFTSGGGVPRTIRNVYRPFTVWNTSKYMNVVC